MAVEKRGYAQFLKNDKKKSTKSVSKMRNSWLAKIAPRRGYSFSSDYIQLDKKVFISVLTIFNNAGSDDDLPPMWGIRLIPFNLGRNVSTHLITQVERADAKWLENAQGKADRVADSEVSEAGRSGQRKNKHLSQKRAEGMDEIARELVSGDSYLHVAFKIMVKAPSLEELELGVQKLTRYYNGQFAKVYVEPYYGQQYDDFQRLLQSPRAQIGKNYGFTSSEFAGEYNLVTHGITDSKGKYVGQLIGDVNSSAVLWDVDRYQKHVVFAADQDAETLGERFDYVRASTMWGLKLAQEALLNNHRVVNFVLNDSKMNIGADLSDITTTISLNKGEINPFEVFGDVEDELASFAMLTNKIRLMTKQLNPDINNLTLETLNNVLQDFYISEGLWVDDAQHNREKLRIVGLPHDQYPLMSKFNGYLQSHRYDNLAQKMDSTEAGELRMLTNIFNRLTTENGDLFNKITADTLDKVNSSYMINYDLSSLMSRSIGIAMAQFVNTLSFATSGLERGDVVIFHGTELIDESVIKYTKTVLSTLYRHDVRVVFLYDSVSESLKSNALGDIPHADWVLFGKMTNPDVDLFEKLLGQSIPSSLSKSIVGANDKTYYLRRNADNVVFEADLVLA